MKWEILDPFENMKRMHKEMDSLFRDFYGKPIHRDVREPLLDIRETKDEVIADIELPGIEKKDIDLEVKENMLSVRAKKKHETETEKEGFYRCERSYSSFQRAFELPAEIVPEKTDAEFKDGLLNIKMKKAKPEVEEHKTKKIEIK